MEVLIEEAVSKVEEITLEVMGGGDRGHREGYNSGGGGGPFGPY